VSDARKYSDEEVSEIFDRATSDDSASVPARATQEGLTLAELQEVGLEVGVSPERVAAAAAALGSQDVVLARRKILGAPISAGRIVDLPRAATDREWDVLVTELRQVFRAEGRISSHGDIRQWSNGNLRVTMEPTEAGHRLRMNTHKTDAKAVTALGVVGMVLGLPLLITSGLDVATFGPTLAVLIPAMMTVAGGGLLSGNFLRLRRWAGERDGQMDYIAERARVMLHEGTPEDPRGPES
jgi:hypothetical protein